MNPKGSLPNFLIAGAQKSGTTSLYYYLAAHPDVFMPAKKEPAFFTSGWLQEGYDPADPRYLIFKRNKILTFQDYVKLFEPVLHHKRVGEASVGNLYRHDLAIPRIQHYLGDPAILIILRNPVDRAYSAYMHFVRDNLERLSFEQALEVEPVRRQRHWDPHWNYFDMGLYSRQVRAYLQSFSRVKVLLFEDLSRGEELVRQVYSFLDLEPAVPLDMRKLERRHNPGGRPRSTLLHKMVTTPNPARAIVRRTLKSFMSEASIRKLERSIRARNLTSSPAMSPDTRLRLTRLYEEDVRQLQELIKQDLSAWLA